MPVALLLALLTAGLWYLSSVDRQSPIALDVVEAESALGVPLYLVGIALTAAVAVAAWVRRRPAARPAARPPLRSRPAAGSGPAALPEGDWYAPARAAAEALPLAPVGELRFDEAVGLPFTLRLRQATVEQARRRIEAYVACLAAIPTPPKGRVYLESSPDVQIAPQHLVGAAMKRHFPAEAYQVLRHGHGVDIVFLDPDPRWRGR